MTWKLCWRSAMTWITGQGFRSSRLFFCTFISCGNPLAIANTGHKPYQTFLPQKSWNIICVALDLISSQCRKSSTDSRGLTEMKWCEGAPDSHSTLNLVVSLGWWAGQEQQRIDATAERVSIQVFWQGNVGIKKGNCLLAWYPLCFYEM